MPPVTYSLWSRSLLNEQMTPAPSSGPQSSTVLWGQSRRDASLPVHRTSSILKVLETRPKWDFMVACPKGYPSILVKFLLWFCNKRNAKVKHFLVFLANLQTTFAFCALWSSSQTGIPPTRMFPSWRPDPPISVTSEQNSVKIRTSYDIDALMHRLYLYLY